MSRPFLGLQETIPVTYTIARMKRLGTTAVGPATMSLFPEKLDLSSPFFGEQLITYIGNKRALLPFINSGIEFIKGRLGKEKITCFDGFVGSGATARLLREHASFLLVNDLEKYCEVVNRCYLANQSEVDRDYLTENIAWLNENKLTYSDSVGFIEANYAPKDDNDVGRGERVFYTNRNAKIIDGLVKLINERYPSEKRHLFLAPLIVKASVHTNTSGVFKGFHKKDGVGHFGGAGENALSRIKREISLEVPVFSGKECKVDVRREDINMLVRSKKFPEFDLAYFDPPYNQHPYGSNYFMLNIIAGDENAKEIQDGVSGISKRWNRSAYNKRVQAEEAMERLISDTPAKFILISYNDEGIISIDTFRNILAKHGAVDLLQTDYNTYRGSRNLRARNIKVKEMLWVLEKK